jgi:site-specific recombinase XerD
LIVIPNVVQWAVKQASKAAGITEVCVHTLAHFATHLLEDGLDIITLKISWDMKI